jgi:hypothetical protein
VLGPIALLLGLLAGEIAVGGVGYVFAYALFVDTVPPKRRLGSLLGFALVVVGWMVTYIAFGFGTSGSEFYIDPVGEPVRFVRAVLSHAPILLTAQWLGPPADMTVLLSTGVWRVVWVAGCVLLVLPAWMFARLLRRDATARFWATGMVIAVVPVCATLPMDRLLFVVGIGAMGLVARFVQCYVNQDATTGTRRITSSAVVLLLVVHGLIAPLALPFRAWSLSMLGSWLQPATAAVPNDPSVEDQTVVVLNAPSVAGASLYLPCMRAAMGLSVPKRVRALANGLYPIHIRRPDAHTLVVQPEGGFLRPPGERLEGDTVDHGPMYLGYTMQIMDRLFRSSTTPMRMGEKITLSGMEVEVISLTPDERPAAARFRFDRPLEDASLLWIRWKDGDYEPYRPPPVGTSVTLPAVQLPTTPFDSLFRTISSRAMRGQMWPRM